MENVGGCDGIGGAGDHDRWAGKINGMDSKAAEVVEVVGRHGEGYGQKSCWRGEVETTTADQFTLYRS